MHNREFESCGMEKGGLAAILNKGAGVCYTGCIYKKCCKKYKKGKRCKDCPKA